MAQEMQQVIRDLRLLREDREADRRTICRLREDREADRRRIFQLEGDREADRRRIDQLDGDVSYLIAQRAITFANQALYEFIGEQPRRSQPCNFFSGLLDSALMRKMLKEVFGCDDRRSRSNMLDHFDSLADGRHVIAHPNLMHHMEWELNKLLPILRREQAVGRLHGIGQTALLVLEKFSRLRDFKPYFPPGLGHAGRLAYVWP